MAEFRDIPDSVMKRYIASSLGRDERFQLSETRKEYKSLKFIEGKISIKTEEQLQQIKDHPEFYAKIWPQLQIFSTNTDFIDRFLAEVEGRKMPFLKALAINGWGEDVSERLIQLLPDPSYLESLRIDRNIVDPETLIRYSSKLKRFSGSWYPLLERNETIEFLEVQHASEEDIVSITRAGFRNSLKYLRINLHFDSHDFEIDHGHEILRNMRAHPEELENRKSFLRPFLEAFPNLRCLRVEGTYPQMAAISSLLSQDEICPNLIALRIGGHGIDRPEASGEGLKCLLKSKPLAYLIYKGYNWPKETLSIIIKSHRLEEFFHLYDIMGSWSTFHDIDQVDIESSPIYVGGEKGIRLQAFIRYKLNDETLFIDIPV